MAGNWKMESWVVVNLERDWRRRRRTI